MTRFVALMILTMMIASTATAVLPTKDEPVRTVYFIRHGEYEHGNDDVDEGCLVALGRQQARLIAERLDAQPVEFTSIQASTLCRARETAELIAPYFPDLEITLHDDIRECTPNTRRQDIMSEMEPGEAADCEANLLSAWQRIMTPVTGDQDEHDIVVCHGNIIRWYVCQVLKVDPIAWLEMSIANGSVTVMQVRADGSMKLISFADSGHIPWGMTTYPGTEVVQ